MDVNSAAGCLEALGNPTRLEIVRQLIRAGLEGMPVGSIQEYLGIPASTLSHHISKLVQAGVATQERQSRTLICRANFDTMRAILRFMTDDCCKGIPR